MNNGNFTLKKEHLEIGDFAITQQNGIICVCGFTTGNEKLSPKGWVVDGIGTHRNPKFLIHYTGPESVIPNEALYHRDALKLIL